MPTGRLVTMKKLSPNLLIVALLITLTAISCTSRYRLDLYLLEASERMRVKLEKTEYVMDSQLGDPMSREKVIRGDNNCLILITGSRGGTLEASAADFVTYDRYVRYQVYLELPPFPQPGTLPLVDHSFVQLMGRYEIPADEKMYLPSQGSLIIDSIADKKLFGTLEAEYENKEGAIIAFEGQFKAKINR